MPSNPSKVFEADGRSECDPVPGKEETPSIRNQRERAIREARGRKPVFWSRPSPISPGRNDQTTRFLTG